MDDKRCKNCCHCYHDEFEIPGDDYYSGFWCEFYCSDFDYDKGSCERFDYC